MPERLLWGALKTDCSVRLGCAKRVLYGSADPAIRSHFSSTVQVRRSTSGHCRTQGRRVI